MKTGYCWLCYFSALLCDGNSHIQSVLRFLAPRSSNCSPGRFILYSLTMYAQDWAMQGFMCCLVFKKFYVELEDNCFTILCWFLPYINESWLLCLLIIELLWIFFTCFKIFWRTFWLMYIGAGISPLSQAPVWLQRALFWNSGKPALHSKWEFAEEVPSSWEF